MIEHLRNFPDGVLAFICKGRVTKADYNSSSRSGSCEDTEGSDEKVRLYYETAADFSAIEPGAMWEDFKVGMEHLTRWERIAVVTDVEWIKQTMRFLQLPDARGDEIVFDDGSGTSARVDLPVCTENFIRID